MKNVKILLGIAAVAVLLLACAPDLAPPAERDAYLDNIELLDVRVGKTLTGRRNVYGQLKNNGTRTLSAVVLDVHYLDDEDSSIRVKQHSLSDAVSPNAAVEFRISVDDAPEKWAERARVNVAELGFAN